MLACGSQCIMQATSRCFLQAVWQTEVASVAIAGCIVRQSGSADTITEPAASGVQVTDATGQHPPALLKSLVV